MIALLLLAAGCPSGEVIDWRFAEQGAPEGVFLSAWGASGDDVWVVGGQPDRGAVLRGAGTSFALVEVPPLTTDVLHGCFVAPHGRPYAVGGNLFTSGDTFLGTILAGRPLE